MKITNVYTASISQYYDQIVQNLYYDYDGLGRDLASLIGKDQARLLEIGIGTGLVAERLLCHGFQVSGIDNSVEMLKIARFRLGPHAVLLQNDIKDYRTKVQYDAIYSVMGPWYVTRGKPGQLRYLSYLRNTQENLDGLLNVRQMLRPGGLLILSIQDQHKNLPAQEISKRTFYSHQVTRKSRFIRKEYFVRKNGVEVAHQQCIFTEYSEAEVQSYIDKLGFSTIQVSNCGKFVFTLMQSPIVDL